MSTDIAADAAIAKPRRLAWTTDLRTVRIVRYAVGVTAAAALAFGFAWPLFFLTPVLTAFFLSLPLPSPALGRALAMIGYVLFAFVLGLVFTLFLLPFPLVYILALGVALFHVYYLINRRGPIMLALMCLLAVLILPMMAMGHEALALGFALYFAGSAAFSVAIYLAAHGLFPDPADAAPMPQRGTFQRHYSKDAAIAALKSTLAVLPIAAVFVTASWTNQMLVMVFAAMFSLSPVVAAGKAAGIQSLTSTLMGGVVALVFYWLIVAVPEFHFFVALMLLTTLVFGAAIFSGKPFAKYLPSAAIAVLILIGGSMGEDVSFTNKLVVRIVLISLATLYIVSALAVLDRFIFQSGSRAAEDPEGPG